MDLRKAQQISDRLSNKYGIKKPPVTVEMKYSRAGKCVHMGYYQVSTNTLGINKYMLYGYSDQEVTDHVIKHELMHALSYQKRGDAHSHDKYFMDLCKKHGLDQRSASARKKPEKRKK
jgi:predicted SprT family Zn-dependent metalloprotease